MDSCLQVSCWIIICDSLSIGNRMYAFSRYTHVWIKVPITLPYLCMHMDGWRGRVQLKEQKCYYPSSTSSRHCCRQRYQPLKAQHVLQYSLNMHQETSAPKHIRPSIRRSQSLVWLDGFRLFQKWYMLTRKAKVGWSTEEFLVVWLFLYWVLFVSCTSHQQCSQN